MSVRMAKKLVKKKVAKKIPKTITIPTIDRERRSTNQYIGEYNIFGEDVETGLRILGIDKYTFLLTCLQNLSQESKWEIYDEDDDYYQYHEDINLLEHHANSGEEMILNIRGGIYFHVKSKKLEPIEIFMKRVDAQLAKARSLLPEIEKELSKRNKEWLKMCSIHEKGKEKYRILSEKPKVSKTVLENSKHALSVYEKNMKSAHKRYTEFREKYEKIKPACFGV